MKRTLGLFVRCYTWPAAILAAILLIPTLGLSMVVFDRAWDW